MASKIISVDKKSPAEKAGIKSGEILISINGNKIRDVMDYKFYGYDDKLIIEIEDENGQKRSVRVLKAEGRDLGLEFESYLMDKAKSCSNSCIFCFIDQLPKNMRRTLYFKDDDARLSFLLGNYITLTNLSEEDVDRIIKMHISPVNVSVQTTNPELRVRMLRNKKAGKSLEIMQKFADNHISMNCQIVVCKDINDGEELKRSLLDLEKFYPAVNSISVVPFGKSKYREGLFEIKSINKQSACEIISIVEDFAQSCFKKYGTRLAFCGDELYIKADLLFHNTEYYEDFTQLENGVGMMPLFVEQFLEVLPDFNGKAARPFCIATGTAAAPFLSQLIDEARIKCDNLIGNVYAIDNNFFGSEVSVAGLITGQDLIKGLEGKEKGERVFISANMLRDGGDVFLDDLTLEDVSKAVGVPVYTVEIDGADLVYKIFDE